MSPRRSYFAHSTSRPDRRDWQPLAEHLRCVAELARERAGKFKAADWGFAAGLLHDLGKYSPEFQARLEGRRERVDHATAGAVEAGRRFGEALARPLQFVVAGHHTGLANGGEEEGAAIRSLGDRLRADIPDYSAYRRECEVPAELPSPRLAPHKDRGGRSDRAGFQAAFFTRMLFSCLVDADYLDTEGFYDRIEGRSPRRMPALPLVSLKPRLDSHLARLAAEAPDTPVNRRRAEILAACRNAAREPPGLFTLTVPTGGGKTLSSLAFALDHAVAHGLDRVIYVIPYTSIIEQNAAVFREAVDADAVLEHHSAFEPADEQPREAREKLRLAMENWDAPVIVTTAVQFFESLFANRPARCRKLHNIAGSVVILDEAQTLPLPLLRPCVATLDELARNYGTSVVLCTATQPALLETEDEATSFKGGLRGVREIAPEPERLYRAFKRVKVERIAEELDDTALADRLVAHEQALCIVHTRAHARELYERIKDETGCFHLSALMCPKHRSQRLGEIRTVLGAGRRCLVVSTSLVEAGVDLDFPVVYRAEAGLDQIAQAAGRCNREGRLPWGEVFVFHPPDRWPRGEMDRRAKAARAVFRRHPDDPLALEALEDFFHDVYWAESAGTDDGLDQKQLLRRLEERRGDLLIPFEAIASDFRLIEDGMLPILIPFDAEARKLVEGLKWAERAGGIGRRLQPYVVQVPPQQFAALRAAGAVQPVAPERFGEQFCWLVNQGLYRGDVGLTWEDPTYRASESNVL